MEGPANRRPKPLLLWFDIASSPQDRDLKVACARYFRVAYETRMNFILEAIGAVSPNALCFEFDQVNPPGLAAMEQALEKYPALPVLMLTVQHAESLAVWSFRVGVWNYLVKPVSVSEFSANLDVLSRICARGGLPLHPKPPDIEEPRDLRSMPVDERVSRLQPALQYVRERFNEKVTEKEAARLCGMQRFAFSRAFHAAFGLTFRAYLMRTRIGEARRLLVEGGHAVTEVCFATGFSDGSYFAAMFKRYTGVLPSHYEKQHQGFPLPRPGAGDGE